MLEEEEEVVGGVRPMLEGVVGGKVEYGSW